MTRYIHDKSFVSPKKNNVMKRFQISFLLFALVLLSTHVTHAQSRNRLLNQAQSYYISGKYELAIHNLYSASVKKATHKKVVAAANTIIPGIFENLENRIAKMQIKRDQSGSSKEKYTYQLEIISKYEQLSKFSSKFKYSGTTPLMHPQAARFLKKNYKERYLEAVSEMDFLEKGKLEEHYKKGLQLMSQGLYKYSEAEKEFSEILKLDQGYKNVQSKMAEIYYDRAMDHMDKNRREDYKKACVFFKKTKQYVSNFRDAAVRYEEAKKAATIRVAVFPFINNSGLNTVGAIGDIQSDNIVASIFDSEFVEIISRDEINLIIREQQLSTSGLVDEQSTSELGKILGVTHILTGKINQIILNPPHTISTKYEEAEKVYVDSNGKVYSSLAGGLGNLANALLGGDGNQYTEKTAKASVQKYTKEASTKLSCSYKLTEIETGKIMKSGTITTGSHFKHQWATYSGSKYGLSKTSKKLAQRSEKIAPSAVAMVNECAEESAQKIAKDIYSFLK
jgi:TolB-like protein